MIFSYYNDLMIVDQLKKNKIATKGITIPKVVNQSPLPFIPYFPFSKNTPETATNKRKIAMISEIQIHILSV